MLLITVFSIKLELHAAHVNAPRPTTEVTESRTGFASHDLALVAVSDSVRRRPPQLRRPTPSQTTPDSSLAQDSTANDTSNTQAPGIRFGRGGGSFSAGMNLNYNAALLEIDLLSSRAWYKGLANDFERIPGIRLGIGACGFQALRRHPEVGKMDADLLFADFFDPTSSSSDTSLHHMSGFSLGLRLGSGYAYLIDSNHASWTFVHRGGLLLYSHNSFSHANSANQANNSADAQVVDGLASSNSGSLSGFSIGWNPGANWGLQFNFDRNMLYSNPSNFAWLASLCLEGISQSVLSTTLVHHIEIKSPKYVAVAALILRSALSFGWYELRRSSQHFPFGGNRPLVNDVFSVGLHFSL